MKILSWIKQTIAKAVGSRNCCGEHSLTLMEDTPSFELFVVEREFEPNGNLKHGALHLSRLLSYNPGRADWLEWLEKYVERAGGEADALWPHEEPLYYSTEAVRAYLWARQGRYAEAVDLIILVTGEARGIFRSGHSTGWNGQV